MTAHLSESDLVDLLGAESQPRSQAHLRDCAACAERLLDAREGLGLARLDSLPEPAAEDWASFQAELKRRIGTAERRRWSRLVPALAAAAVLVAAFSAVVPRLSRPIRPSATLPAWTPLPPRESDSGLRVLEEVLVAADDWSTAGCRGVGDCLASLDEDETAALADALRRRPAGDGL